MRLLTTSRGAKFDTSVLPDVGGVWHLALPLGMVPLPTDCWCSFRRQGTIAVSPVWVGASPRIQGLLGPYGEEIFFPNSFFHSTGILTTVWSGWETLGSSIYSAVHTRFSTCILWFTLFWKLHTPAAVSVTWGVHGFTTSFGGSSVITRWFNSTARCWFGWPLWIVAPSLRTMVPSGNQTWQCKITWFVVDFSLEFHL